MSETQRPLTTYAVVALAIIVIGTAAYSFNSPNKSNAITSTSISTVNNTVTSTIVRGITYTTTSFSVSDITFPVSTLIIPTTLTSNQISTYTQTITSTSTITSVSTLVLVQSTLIIVGNTQTTTSSQFINGQITTYASITPTNVYSGSTITLNVTINNGIQPLTMTITPYIQSCTCGTGTISWIPQNQTSLVNTGTSRFIFSGSVHSPIVGTTNWTIGVKESYTYNGFPYTMTTSTNLVVLDPLQISSYELSGNINGNCTQNTQNTNNPNDYNCTISGTPNSSGIIKFHGQNYGNTMCMTWTIINPVLQVFAQEPYTHCTNSNGMSGAIVTTEQFQIWFTIGIPSNANSQSIYNVEFTFQ